MGRIKSRSAFSLVEVMVSLAVLLVAVLSLMPLLGATERIRGEDTVQLYVKDALARSMDEVAVDGFLNILSKNASDRTDFPPAVSRITTMVKPEGANVRLVTMIAEDGNGERFDGSVSPPKNPAYRLQMFRTAD